jgi:hypothetical protein
VAVLAVDMSSGAVVSSTLASEWGEGGQSPFVSARRKLNDAMDDLIGGVARLQLQLNSFSEKGANTLRTIKEHVRDETEEFATAANFL